MRRGYNRQLSDDPMVQASRLTTMVNVKFLDQDLDRIELALERGETRSAFIRRAVEKELVSRHGRLRKSRLTA